MWQSGYSNLEVREWGEVIHILSLKTRELRWGGGGGGGVKGQLLFKEIPYVLNQ